MSVELISHSVTGRHCSSNGTDEADSGSNLFVPIEMDQCAKLIYINEQCDGVGEKLFLPNLLHNLEA